jgi:hypothetical protein
MTAGETTPKIMRVIAQTTTTQDEEDVRNHASYNLTGVNSYISMTARQYIDLTEMSSL